VDEAGLARKLMANFFILVLIFLMSRPLLAQAGEPRVSKVWNPDNGDGRYRNPILYADYSDPDVIRVNNDFYLVASSFDAVPGLPILHSKDLIHWEIVAHALNRQPPELRYSSTQHGNGAWAPAIRYHNGFFFIYYPDPDFGIYMTKSRVITGPWSEPVLVKAAKGWIDPCPLWDDNGTAWLVNGLAGSRSGTNSAIVLSRMSSDGSRVLDNGAIIIDGHAVDPTLEGPKIYKRHGYYYVSAPAGGVPSGWQVVFRSHNIYGPYERRVVLAQGHTAINGPHQGGWVDTPSGEFWFVHFQDQGVYGRVTLLEPMHWKDDWPEVGIDQDAQGLGEPVSSFRRPRIGPAKGIYNPADSDEFSGASLGGQWQWQANPGPTWAFPMPSAGTLRLFNIFNAESEPNLWTTPNVLLQKFPSNQFAVTTKFAPHLTNIGDQTGLVVVGKSYSAVILRNSAKGLVVLQTTCPHADQGDKEVEESAGIPVTAATVYLRAQVDSSARVQFFYSVDGQHFEVVGTTFQAVQGTWIGAKIGLFATGAQEHGGLGYSDFDYFRFDR